MKIPTVHLNGTAWSDLNEQTHAALGALRLAVEALRDAAPNARDFYVQGPGAFEEARQDHRRRLLAVDEVLQEVQEIALGIADQEPVR